MGYYSNTIGQRVYVNFEQKIARQIMKITIIGLALFFVGFFAVFRTIKKIQRGDIGYRPGLIWMTIWGGACVVGLFPDFINIAMEISGLKNRTVFAIIIAVFVLYALVFQQEARFERMNRDIRKLVREIAILNYKLEGKNRGLPRQDDIP